MSIAAPSGAGPSAAGLPDTASSSAELPVWSGPALAVGRLPEVTAALAARAEAHDRDGSFPADGIAEVHAAGLLTATVAERYGGPGSGLAQTVALLRALGRGDPSVALVAAMTLFTHAAQAQDETWPGSLYAEVLEESARQPVLINALRVEPELGTPARGGLPATTARRVPGGCGR
jgi:alkylation response protein AidB-like acyl-CoA dehydrogenase